MITKLRVFHKDNLIVWTYSLDGKGEFAHTLEEYAKITPEIDGCECIELIDQTKIDAFMASDDNSIVKGKLVTGKPRPIIKPEPVRDLAKEIDTLKAKVAELEKKVK